MSLFTGTLLVQIAGTLYVSTDTSEQIEHMLTTYYANDSTDDIEKLVENERQPSRKLPVKKVFHDNTV